MPPTRNPKKHKVTPHSPIANKPKREKYIKRFCKVCFDLGIDKRSTYRFPNDDKVLFSNRV